MFIKVFLTLTKEFKIQEKKKGTCISVAELV